MVECVKSPYDLIKVCIVNFFSCNTIYNSLQYNDRLFSEKFTMKDYISNTKLEQGDHYYIQTRYKDLFSHYNLILRKLYEKMSRKALENTNEMCSCPLGIL